MDLLPLDGEPLLLAGGMSPDGEAVKIKAEELRKGDQAYDGERLAWTALDDAGTDSLGAIVTVVEYADGGRSWRAWLPGAELEITRGRDWRSDLRAPIHESEEGAA